jgi:hypothetical protein
MRTIAGKRAVVFREGRAPLIAPIDATIHEHDAAAFLWMLRGAAARAEFLS